MHLRIILSLLLVAAFGSSALAAKHSHHKHRAHHHRSHHGTVNVDEPMPGQLLEHVHYVGAPGDNGRTRNDHSAPVARLSTTRTVTYVNKHTDDLNQFPIAVNNPQESRLIAPDLLRFNQQPIVLANQGAHPFGVNYQKRPGYNQDDADKEGRFWAQAANMTARSKNDENASKHSH